MASAVVQALPAIVFVSRRIGASGSIYYVPARNMPGIGPHGRLDSAAPGRLVVRVRIDDVSGTFYGMRVASLAEVEVMARGEAP